MKTCVKVALLSCVVNGLLMSAKFFLGELSGSMALKADAVHSLADVISSLSILGGILIADRRTKTFPLGLYKVENLVSLGSSFFIFFAAYQIASEAAQGSPAEAIQNPGPVIAGVLVMLIVAYLYSQYELRAGLQAGSPSLVADAKHIAADVFSFLVVLAAILGTYLGVSLDRYAALVVVALVVYMGLTILVGSLKVLLDATLDYATLDSIRTVLAGHPLVTGINALGGRSSGRYKFVEANVRVDARLLRDAHEAVSHLEDEILDRWPEIDRILIHYEPEQKASILAAIPLDAAGKAQPGLDSPLSEHFGEAPCFALLRKDTLSGKVSFETFVENQSRNLDRHRGVKAAEFLADLGVEEVWGRAELLGKGAGYALEALGIDVLVVEALTLKQLLPEPGEEAPAPERKSQESTL
jgi:cation diffusion facilitator family transporter